MTPMITEIETIPPASLLLVYSTGEKREFDITPLLGKGLFASLKDPRLFSQARISFDTVSWPNGLDIDPERLYEDSLPIDRKTQA